MMIDLVSHGCSSEMNLKQRSGGCEEAWTAQLDSNAREAKERLDQKLRNQRQSVAKRYLRFFFVRATTLLDEFTLLFLGRGLKGLY